MEPEDVLSAIDRFLSEPALDEPYDPTYPAMDQGWERQQRTKILESVETRTPTTARKVSIVGCVIQRSDRQQRQKQQWLSTPPPPLPTRKPAARAQEATLKPARVMGPLSPPPIPVEIEPGLTIDVPHFAAHVSRRYKARFGGRHWIIRFNADGTVRSTKTRA